jgi:hypothetical protein
MSDFDPKTIKPRDPEKPHIVFIDGMWRLSLNPPPYHLFTKQYYFKKARRFVERLNWELR